MKMQSILDRINEIIESQNYHELNLLKADLEDDIIWEQE